MRKKKKRRRNDREKEEEKEKRNGSNIYLSYFRPSSYTRTSKPGLDCKRQDCLLNWEIS
jgi:hypothetical protein